MESDDLPKDLTFNDPAITARPVKLAPLPPPKPEVATTPLGKLRDLSIGILLLLGFFGALYAVSLLIKLRGK